MGKCANADVSVWKILVTRISLPLAQSQFHFFLIFFFFFLHKLLISCDKLQFGVFYLVTLGNQCRHLSEYNASVLRSYLKQDRESPVLSQGFQGREYISFILLL